MARRVLAGPILLVAFAVAAYGEEPREPTYADKPASWWIDELVSGDNPDAARSVLQKMGADAAPSLAARLPTLRASKDRRALLDLLTSIRTPLPPSVVPRFATCLASSDRAEQVSALRLVGALGPAAAVLTEGVAKLLESPQESVRSAACQALGAIGGAAAAHVPGLVARVGDPSDAVSYAAASALVRIGVSAPGELPSLLEIAERRPRPDQLRALAVLGPDDARVTDAIVRGADRTDPGWGEVVRELVAHRLAVGDVLRQTASRLSLHRDAAVRSAAAAGLGRWASARHTTPPELLELLADRDVAGAAAAALELCAAFDRAWAPRVPPIWVDSHAPGTFVPLLRLLASECGPDLLDAAASEREDLRAAAWHVIQRLPGGRLSADGPRLTRLLFDTRIDAALRGGVVALLASPGVLADDRVRLDAFAAVAREGDPSLALRSMSSLSGDADRRSALLVAAARPEAAVRAEAIVTLGVLVHRFDDVRALCLKALDDPDAQVRRVAFAVLTGGPTGMYAPGSPEHEAIASRLPAMVAAGPAQRRDVLLLFSRSRADWRPLASLLLMLAHDDVASTAEVWLRQADFDPDVLVPLVRGDDPVLAARAAGVLLARRRDAEAVAKLPDWLASDDPRVAGAAAIAASALPAEDVVRFGGALVRAARGGAGGVAMPACHALAKIAAQEPEAAAALLAVADDSFNSAHAAVAPFLNALGKPGRVRLVKLLESPVHDARRTACLVLESLAAEHRAELQDAIPALERLAASDDLEIARIAERSLTALRR